MVGSATFSLRLVVWADESRQAVGLLRRRTPSAASAIQTRAAPRYKFSDAVTNCRFTYILGRRASANCQERVASHASGHHGATDHLAYLCVQWTNTNHETTVAEVAGWRLLLRHVFSLPVDCQNGRVFCHLRPQPPSPNNRREPLGASFASLRQCIVGRTDKAGQQDLNR